MVPFIGNKKSISRLFFPAAIPNLVPVIFCISTNTKNQCYIPDRYIHRKKFSAKTVVQKRYGMMPCIEK
ncbi:hypothetical protein D1164_16560 [Mariniphaga sediminis]|uniref:Uncharacterized protein n=1 Tax=Mariniphaga sediminis TaxID=1628158 RepID=A0A399CY79_9BACT|nr:hypothetical protein D1164_16560 [Mariniphaga sediminis]